jgi:hypothetical protein
MTLPGKMLSESVKRLADTIAGSKAVSDELKAATVPVAAQPVPVQEVTNESGSGTEQQAAR